jgi:hypothetical protein
MRPVWHDELYTLALARLPVGELFSALVVDSGPPLHYLLCRALFALVGWPEGSAAGTLVVRLPSVLAFALLPWVVWRARTARCEAIPWGSLLVVVWLPLLYFGTEARAYALLALVNTFLWVRGVEWIDRGGFRTALFAALAACLPLLHYTGFASFVALPALALFIPPEKRQRLVLALGAAALPVFAWLPVMLDAPRASMGWLETAAGPGRPGLATLCVLAPAGPFPALFEFSSMPIPAWASLTILGVLVAGAAAGVYVLGRDGIEARQELRRVARLGLGLAPSAALGLAALVGVPLYFAGRTESMVWTLAASLVAILISGLPPAVKRIVVGAYVLVGAVTVVLWSAGLADRPLPPGVEVGRELASRIEDGDRVVVAGLWQLEVRHGLAEASLTRSTSPVIVVETIPRSQSEHPGWLDREAVTSPQLLDEAFVLRESSEADRERIWLIWSPGLPLERNLFPAFSGWGRVRVAGSPLIAVDLLTPPPARPSSPTTESEARSSGTSSAIGRLVVGNLLCRLRPSSLRLPVMRVRLALSWLSSSTASCSLPAHCPSSRSGGR